MRRVVSPLRGEARPRKRFCPPRTRSPHLNLSQPPFEAWCADPIHPHFHSGWQLGDAFVFPPLQPVHSPPASRMLGDIAVSLLQCTESVPATRQPSTSLSAIPSKDAEGFPSRWRVPLLPGLLDTPSQVCLPLHDTMIPLSHFLHEWERLPGVSLWVLRTIRTGYTLQFGKNPPRFDGVHLTVVNSAAKASVLQQELSSLLQKGAIEEVPQSEVERGFFSRYFLVPKRDGGLRPILDLRRLNLSLYKGKFKMLTMRTIMSQVQEGDWFVTIDLKDAYFHIQVVHRHRRFLRFAFGGKAYQYKVLPFGLALAPRTFTKCMDAALAPLRLQGIRVLNYLDDWLILAHSRELVSRHRDIVLGHIHSLGLRMNAKKSVLLPSQRTVFLGVRLDSVQMQARLAPARIPVFTACLARFKLDHHVSVGTCRRLLGLMAAASPVLPLGLLHMRPFLWWMKELRLHPTVPATRLVRVSRSCCRHLLMWRDPVFLRSGVRMGAIHRRHMITTDASMTGWGAVFEGRPASGEWKEEFLFWHINCLELRAVFLALKYFLPVLGEHHVIVRTDNMAVVSHINRQGGSRSRTLDRLARHLLLWSQDKFLSLRAVHVPGVLNLAADFLSRQKLKPGEWMLNRQTVSQIWDLFGKAEVDLFASQESSQCPLWFSLSFPTTLGIDAFAHPWPNVSLYAFPPIKLIPAVLCRVKVSGARLLLIAPFWPSQTWFSELTPLLYRPPWEIPIRRDLLSQLQGKIWHPQPELWKLWVWPIRAVIDGLPAEVQETIASARAPATRKLYSSKWGVFESWCLTRAIDPVNCPVGPVLEFLQERLTAGAAATTLRVYVAAIAARRELDEIPLGRHRLVSAFMRGARRLRPVRPTAVPSWDLSVVLEGLVTAPFEPLESASYRILTLKVVLLLALTSLKRVGDLQAFSVSETCMDFAPGLVKVTLRPRPGYIPKVLSTSFRSQVVTLHSFHPPPFASSEDERLHMLCPVRALKLYVDRSKVWRKSPQLLICFGAGRRGLATSKQRISHWVRDAISLAYEARELPSPLSLRAHSTRGVASSQALFRGVPLEDICVAAGWSSPHTFVRFYNLDVDTAPGSQVLSV